MGKYMKKSKITGVNVMDVSEPTSLGVRTRAAKALALKRRLNHDDSASSSCYLQLRSRRLERPPSQSGIKESGCPHSDPAASGSVSLDFESRCSSRESTPCNFVEDLAITGTPGSSTRSMGTATKDYRDCMVPTASELEEFFAYAEQQQQRLFMEKYNFDIVNDVPLTGRYEWVQVSP
ncbi:hypothetical protein AALP_AA6G093100 [Arabis alpina]|uniref:Cyclin-dependent kinase inhibitor domain-containing protein n=1 Tax=Arabis alpina TaxID=50452 RepID=A0A087GN36_ARAAL|nr:hypothetical protein AALP_AA6G093100 [Arabis alpina]